MINNYFGGQKMYFLINDERTHGEEGHWDVTVTDNVEAVTQDWLISEDLELEGLVAFLGEALIKGIKTICVQQILAEKIIPEKWFARYFQVEDFM